MTMVASERERERDGERESKKHPLRCKKEADEYATNSSARASRIVAQTIEKKKCHRMLPCSHLPS
jgi:hypothetical protein